MNLVFTPQITQVPEWKQCYIDAQLLNQLLTTIANTKKFINTLTRKVEKLEGGDRRGGHVEVVEEWVGRVRQIGDGLVGLFYGCVQLELEVFGTFAQYKIYEVQGKFLEYVGIIGVLKIGSKEMLVLLENLYIQAYYLKHAIYYNLTQKQQLIHNFLLLQPNPTTPQTPQTPQTFSTPSLSRSKLKSKTLKSQIQQTYTSLCIYNNKKWSLITLLSSPTSYPYPNSKHSPSPPIHKSFYIGVVMGSFISFICVLVVLNVVNDIGIGSNGVFTQNFPVWRGASQVVFYVWVLGLDVLVFEKMGINYRLIFYHDGDWLAGSKFYFGLASVLSLLYLVLFLVFMLEIIEITVHPHFLYYGQIFWLIFLLYLFLPIPILNWKGRSYLLKMSLQILLSFCVPISFMTIWLSQQLISLTQPLTDLFYTIFFFITKDPTLTKQIVPNFNSGLVIAVFVYRMVQNLKFWYQLTQAREDKKYDFMAPPFLGFCRAVFGALTGICAMVYRLRLFQGAFVLWLVVIILSTLVAWYVDVRGDWGLLLHEHGMVLRPKLLFPSHRSMYIFIMIINLGLRTAWALTISPFFLNSTGVWSVLFVMFISFIQIFRRGVWNILRIENEHIRNCQKYQATVSDQHLLKIAREKCNQIKNKNKQSEHVLMRISSGSTMRIIEDFYLGSRVRKNGQGNQDTEEMERKERNQRIRRQVEVFREGLERRDGVRKRVVEEIGRCDETINKIKSKLIFVNLFQKLHKK